MPQKQRTLESIFPKKLSLVERTWEKRNGDITVSYRARIRTKITPIKFAFFSLKATNVTAAKEEAIQLYLGLAGDIQRGHAVGNEKKKLSTFICSFIEHMEHRAKNGKITARRVVVVRQLLRSLEKFHDSANKPAITKLPYLYETDYEKWRDQSLSRLRNTPLTPATRNNEANAHRQFFGYLKDQHIVDKIPTVYQFAKTPTNYPFPDEYYRPLLKAMRDDISKQRNPKTQWNWYNMRMLILLMANTGCRVTEARNLRWSNIKSSKGETRIYLHGKNKEREITVGGRLASHFEELRAYKQKNGSAWEWNEQDYPQVLSSWKMKKCPNQFDSAGRRKWYEAIGLDSLKYPLVCFRHRFISNALRKGAPALQIAWYCGTSVNMIQQTYGKITPPDLYEQVFNRSPLAHSNDSDKTSKWFKELLAQSD